MFNILALKPAGAIVLDLFAGSGALGIEAISRGANSAVFIDQDRKVLHLLRQNVEQCNIVEQATVIQWDIRKNLHCLKAIASSFDLVFMDPPYGRALVAKAIEQLLHIDCLMDGATIVAEHEPEAKIEHNTTLLTLSDTRRYGSNQLSFFQFHR